MAGSFEERPTLGRAGDRAALDELFARWRPLLRLQASQALGPDLAARVEPSDVVQEALAAAFAGERLGLAVILADPDHDAAGATGPAGPPPAAGLRGPDPGPFRSLPGFAREANAVARLLAGRAGWTVRRYVGARAGKEALAAARRPRLLYLITHGFFLPDPAPPRAGARGLRELELVDTAPASRPLPLPADEPALRGGLALAGANRWRERSEKGLSDGLLTALEAQGLDLWGTELVVLSACETGLGEVRAGEGVLGLRRAFQQAGARSVLASLWKVPDAETEPLMKSFFAHWLAGKPRPEALRGAQLDLIARLREDRDARRRAAPPLLWAGFICHGSAE